MSRPVRGPSAGPVPLPDGPLEGRLSLPPAPVPEAFVSALSTALGPDAVTVEDAALDAAGSDWWPLAATWAVHDAQITARPAVVARPDDPEGVIAAIRLAGEHRVPLTTAAGRSGVCGGASPVAGGVVLDVTRMAGLVDVDDTSLVARVLPGTFGDDLERSLAEQNLTLGHWPQSMELSTVGGWVACRSAGQYSTRYGKIEDMVAALVVVDGRGRLIRTGGAPRAATGPDLTGLFVGSEGTLGVVTEVALRLHPRPAGTAFAAYAFVAFADGLDAIRRIVRRGANPAVLRLYDGPETARNFGEDGCLLVVLDEGDEEAMDLNLGVVATECHRTPGVQRRDRRLVGQWLEHRNDVSALAKAVGAGMVVETVEVAARWSALPGLYESVVAAVSAVPGVFGATAHCSHVYRDGGCLYFTLAGAAEDRDALYVAALGAAMDATLAAGGAISHHHGIGVARAPWLPAALGDGAFAALADCKAALDPTGILNPGKLGLPSPFVPHGWDWTASVGAGAGRPAG